VSGYDCPARLFMMFILSMTPFYTTVRRFR
jgi:hypothetical protein